MKRLVLLLALIIIGGGAGTAHAQSIKIGNACTLRAGSGSPESSVYGSICDSYWRTDTGTIYLKQSGTATTTGWVLQGGSGTVTSVALTVPGIFSVSGSPITISGTLAVSLASQSANLVFASPNGSSGTPTFRAAVLRDLGASGCLSGAIPKFDGLLWQCGVDVGAATGAPSTEDYIVGTATANLSAEQSLGALTTGLLKNTVSGSTGTLSTAVSGTDYAPANPSWSTLSAPSGTLSLSHGTNTTTFTWATGTSTSNLFTLQDTTGNTGTGYLFTAGSVGTSTLKPFRVLWQGNARITVNENGETQFGGQYAATEYDAGNSGTSLALNWRNGNQQLVALTGNVTFTFSNPIYGATYRLILVQDATGGRTVTWPATVKWENDTAPTLTTTANKVVFCSLVYTSVGSDGYLGWCTTSPISQP
jgi:hypothetical protein